MRAHWMAAAALVAAAPLAAQSPAPRPACVPEASVGMGMVMTRYACAGTGDNAAVRLSASLPDGWEVAWQDAGHLVLTATEGDIVIQVVGADQLPEPRTARDTVGFWMRATEMMTGGDVQSAGEVDDFRAQQEDRTDNARAWLTLAQLEEESLRAMAEALAVDGDGRQLLRRTLEVRELAGEPAGYLSETWAEGGTEWTADSYVTVRDGALFIVSLTTPERLYVNVINSFDSVLLSFDPRTERW